MAASRYGDVEARGDGMGEMGDALPTVDLDADVVVEVAVGDEVRTSPSDGQIHGQTPPEDLKEKDGGVRTSVS